MTKLQQYLHDYGTDGLDAMVQALMNRITPDDAWAYQAAKITSKMSKLLAEALKEIPRDDPKPLSVDEAKDLFMNHSW